MMRLVLPRKPVKIARSQIRARGKMKTGQAALPAAFANANNQNRLLPYSCLYRNPSAYLKWNEIPPMNMLVW
jgi:hypothetical protein